MDVALFTVRRIKWSLRVNWGLEGEVAHFKGDNPDWILEKGVLADGDLSCHWGVVQFLSREQIIRKELMSYSSLLKLDYKVSLGLNCCVPDLTYRNLT